MNYGFENANPKEKRGWEIVKELNNITDDAAGVSADAALNSRRLLAEYLKLETHRPSRLHSAILSCAVKMTTRFPSFHFVLFADMWGMENLRPEDSESRTGDDGKRFPSLVERMVKAYAYSLLFYPGEHLSAEEEQLMKPVLQKKGYRVGEDEKGFLTLAVPAVATRVFTSEVRNRKMTFVHLLTSKGEEMSCEVHTLTQYQRMRYDDIPGRLFNVLLRTSDNGNLRIEAACPNGQNIESCFSTSVGYIDHVDQQHRHIHVFDNESRHLVAQYANTTNLHEGQYVRFIPIIPKESNFKSALITSVLDNGAESFGYRRVVVTYADEAKGYCAWQLLPDADGQILPIVETGAKQVQEPATTGYIHKQWCQASGLPLPQKGQELLVITFLKRGKDGKKRPVVVGLK